MRVKKKIGVFYLMKPHIDIYSEGDQSVYIL